MRIIGLFLVLLVCIASSVAAAAPSEPILMIDGNGDGVVELAVFDTASNFHFGYYDGGFQQILAASGISATITFAGGDFVDFAIQSAIDSTIFKLSDGSATLSFAGGISAQNSITPAVPFDYWDSMVIVWNVGNNNQVAALSVGDGFAPASAVPEPGTGLLLGLGLVGLARKRRVMALPQ